MTFDPTKIRMAFPRNPTDKILGVYTGTLSVAAPTAGQIVLYTEQTQPTGFGDSTLTEAIYSTDGGVTWNDDNMTTPNLSLATPIVQTLDVTSFSDANGNIGIATANWYSATLGAGVAYTIQYKIFALAKQNQGVLTPSITNYRLNYSSADNYLKINSQGISPQSLGIGINNTLTDTHNLGYVPTARAYIEYASTGRTWPATRNQYPATGLGTSNNPIQTSIRPDTSKVDYVMVNSGSATTFNLHYRSYLDQ